MAAPVLEDIRRTVTISLPGYEGSEVEIYDGVVMTGYPVVQALMKNADDVNCIIDALMIMIKGWNFVDKEQNPLPVNRDTISIISPEALTFLADSLVKAMADKKKA